jgi:hypothetical protein
VPSIAGVVPVRFRVFATFLQVVFYAVMVGTGHGLRQPAGSD